MRLAKWIFLIAGGIGLLTTVPLLLTEDVVEVRQPEFYYGFVCLNICWQILYLFISSDPIRYRPMMIPAILAKASGTISLTSLFFVGRVSMQWVMIGAVDGIIAVLFLVAYWSSRRQSKPQPA